MLWAADGFSMLAHSQRHKTALSPFLNLQLSFLSITKFTRPSRNSSTVARPSTMTRQPSQQQSRPLSASPFVNHAAPMFVQHFTIPIAGEGN